MLTASVQVSAIGCGRGRLWKKNWTVTRVLFNLARTSLGFVMYCFAKRECSRSNVGKGENDADIFFLGVMR